MAPRAFTVLPQNQTLQPSTENKLESLLSSHGAMGKLAPTVPTAQPVARAVSAAVLLLESMYSVSSFGVSA